MTRIKLCGLRRAEDIAAVNRLHPDFAGVILARNPKFWRAVAPEQAERLRRALLPEIPLIGVFVDDEEAYITSLLRRGVIDMAQLHGRESEEFILCLQQRTGKPIIKAFQIHSEADIARAAASPADYLLLDAGTGCGKTFDWSLLETMKRPYFLAGGLTADNAAEAIRSHHPWGVDVSSGVETDRIKDPEKMAAFVAAVRNTDQSSHPKEEQSL